MQAIAVELGTSRSTVSRLLSLARESGLVEIRIADTLAPLSRLHGEIQDRFGVTAHIVPVPDSVRDVDRLERVAIAAARTLVGFVSSAQTIGVAWGATMSAVSRHLPHKETHDTHIVQLNGAGNFHTSGVDYASEILRRFGVAFSARVHQFPVPAFFDNPATRDAVWRERSTLRVLELHERMDLAVFGIGSLASEVPSHVYAGRYLQPHDINELQRAHVVGDVATVFYRIDGTVSDIPLNERATGPSPDILRATARRVCIVSGTSKSPAVHGALAAGLVTNLILDEGAARALLRRPRV